MVKGHGLPLYLPDELVLALAEVQVKFKLGKTFAGLLMLTEGAHKLGVIGQETYEFFRNRYTTKLVERPKKELSPVRRTVVPTLKQVKEKAKLEELEKTYSNVLEQWSTMKQKSKDYYLRKAETDLEEYPDLNNAKLLLDLRNNNLEVRD